MDKGTLRACLPPVFVGLRSAKPFLIRSSPSCFRCFFSSQFGDCAIVRSRVVLRAYPISRGGISCFTDISSPPNSSFRTVSCVSLLTWLRGSVLRAPQYPPPPRPPSDDQFWLPGRTKTNAAFLRRHFYHEGRVLEHQALWLLREATMLLRTEPNVLSVTSPVTSTRSFFFFPLFSPASSPTSHQPGSSLR